MPLTQDLTKFTTASQSIASYNYTDIASGLGYSTFYLSYTIEANTGKLILTESKDPGEFINLGWGSATYTAFDLSPFNLPKTVKGKVYFTGMVDYNGATNIQAKLAHYDGTTETIIGVETTSTTVNVDQLFNLSFDVSEKLFAAGDILRLYVKSTNANSKISVDPSGTYPAGITPSKITVPFKIDV